ncbi:hypothetical protein [Bacillus infantis]|nr:hypothetical protein [Bacillus infantis]
MSLRWRRKPVRVSQEDDIESLRWLSKPDRVLQEENMSHSDGGEGRTE